MSLMFAEFSLSNPKEAGSSPLAVRALVDTSALMLCIPPEIAPALNLQELERREVTLADGGKHQVPYVGPVQVSFAGRNCFTGAFVLGLEVLIGAIPLEDMDLVISPATRQVVVNPLSPNIPSAILTQAQPPRNIRYAGFSVSSL